MGYKSFFLLCAKDLRWILGEHVEVNLNLCKEADRQQNATDMEASFGELNYVPRLPMARYSLTLINPNSY